MIKLKSTLFLLLFTLIICNAQNSVNTIVIGTVDSLQSKILNETRQIWIYVPDNGNPKQRYPVVYLLDGDWYFHSFTGVVNHLGDISGNSVIPDMIVVGIVNTDRIRDLTPTVDSLTNETNGGGEAFTSFIEKELIPFVDTHYPTTPYRMLVGHSIGGLLVVNTLLKHPSLFNSYVALDPSLWWDNKKLLKESASILKENNLKDKSLYLAIANSMKPGMNIEQGKTDTTASSAGIRSVLEFENILKTTSYTNLNWRSKYYSEESHGTVPLISSYDALRFAFSFYKRPSFVSLSDSSANILVSHYKNLSERMGYTILPPENLISGLAWRFRLEKKYDKGYEFLNTIKETYPDYPVVYNELGRMLEEKGEKDKASEFYKKGNELASIQNPENATLQHTNITASKISPTLADSLMNHMVGRWKIKSKFFDSEKNKMETIQGKATWKKTLNNQYIQEEFELNFFGQVLKGQGFLKYSSLYQRFEFIQVDEFSPGSLILVGHWDEKNQILSFRPITGYAQWGDKKELQLEWDYYFYPDGSFRKEMRLPDKEGRFVFASDYHYSKK